MKCNAGAFNADVASRLIGQFRGDELAIEACDVGDRLVFGAFGLASAGVGAVSKAQFFHRHHHSLGTFCCFGLALVQKCQLTNILTN